MATFEVPQPNKLHDSLYIASEHIQEAIDELLDALKLMTAGSLEEIAEHVEEAKPLTKIVGELLPIYRKVNLLGIEAARAETKRLDSELRKLNDKRRHRPQ